MPSARCLFVVKLPTLRETSMNYFAKPEYLRYINSYGPHAFSGGLPQGDQRFGVLALEPEKVDRAMLATRR